jgi:hypothetical protein
MAKTELFVRKQSGGMFTVVNESRITGNIFWVDSGSATGADAAGYGQNPDAPFLTLDYAIGQCTANNGDHIFVMPGHAETKAAAGALFTADVAGVTVICLGEGADRPTFTFSHTGATSTISAASFKMKNFLFVTGIDSVVTFATVSGADCELVGEIRDTTDTEVVDGFTVTGDRFKATILHRGYTGGDANLTTITLDGVAGADIKVVALGKAGTAVVNMTGHACSDVVVDGTFLVTSTTDLSKTVKDTITGSTWLAKGFDLGAGCHFSGGSGAALAKDDVSAVATTLGSPAGASVSADIAAIKAQTDELGAAVGASISADIAAIKAQTDELGAAVGASISADIAAVKAQTDELGAAVGASISADIAAVQAQANTIDAATMAVAPVAGSLARFVASGGTALGTPLADSKSLVDALGTNGTAVTDSAVSVLGAIGANNADNAFDSSTVVANADGSALERLEFLQVSLERCIEKADGSVPLGDDDLFTIAGGPILVTEFIGYVSTEIGADATTCTIQEAVTAPAGDVALSTAVAIETDAVGTTYHFTAATPGVLTAVTAGAFDQLPKNYWLLTPGTVQATFSAATTGAIKWYMVYKPLSPNCVVTAAA